MQSKYSYFIQCRYVVKVWLSSSGTSTVDVRTRRRREVGKIFTRVDEKERIQPRIGMEYVRIQRRSLQCLYFTSAIDLIARGSQSTNLFREQVLSWLDDHITSLPPVERIERQSGRKMQVKRGVEHRKNIWDDVHLVNTLHL